MTYPGILQTVDGQSFLFKNQRAVLHLERNSLMASKFCDHIIKCTGLPSRCPTPAAYSSREFSFSKKRDNFS